MRRKKAVSPVVATVLLIMIVIILAIIILLWARGFVREAITKEVGGERKNVEQYCGEVRLQPILNDIDGSFGFTNVGSVPLYAFNIRLSQAGRSDIIEISDSRVNPGFSAIASDDFGQPYNYEEYEEVVVIPVLLGETSGGAISEYRCPDAYAVSI